MNMWTHIFCTHIQQFNYLHVEIVTDRLEQVVSLRVLSLEAAVFVLELKQKIVEFILDAVYKIATGARTRFHDSRDIPTQY